MIIKIWYVVFSMSAFHSVKYTANLRKGEIPLQLIRVLPHEVKKFRKEALGAQL